MRKASGEWSEGNSKAMMVIDQYNCESDLMASFSMPKSRGTTLATEVKQTSGFKHVKTVPGFTSCRSL